MPSRSPAKTPSASTPTFAPTRAKNTPSRNNKKSASIEKIEKVPVKSRKHRTQTPMNKKTDVDLSQATISPPVLAGAQSAKNLNQFRIDLEYIKSTVQKLLEFQQRQQQHQSQPQTQQQNQQQQQAPTPVAEIINASAEGEVMNDETQCQVDFVLSEFDKLSDAYNSKVQENQRKLRQH